MGKRIGWCFRNSENRAVEPEQRKHAKGERFFVQPSAFQPKSAGVVQGLSITPLRARAHARMNG